MTTEQTAPTEAQRRAAEAAEQLAAEGKPVTNRTVRERARVAMAVAAEAARVWNENAEQGADIPDAPDSFRIRLNGIWRAAYVAAREEFDTERDVLTGRLRAAEDENQALVKDLTEAEAQIDQSRAERDADREQAQRDSDELRARIAELEAERDAATRAVSAAEGVAAGLREALAALNTPTSD